MDNSCKRLNFKKIVWVFFCNLSSDKTRLDSQKYFDAFLLENDLAILEKEFSKRLYAYLFFMDNYILADKEDNIIGLCLKNISLQELETLKGKKSYSHWVFTYIKLF